MGMPHKLAGSIGRLKATAQALDAIGAVLAESSMIHFLKNMMMAG
jgi:hypothetical protein